MSKEQTFPSLLLILKNISKTIFGFPKNVLIKLWFFFQTAIVCFDISEHIRNLHNTIPEYSAAIHKYFRSDQIGIYFHCLQF